MSLECRPGLELGTSQLSSDEFPWNVVTHHSFVGDLDEENRILI